MKILSIRKLNGPGNLRAEFTVQLDDPEIVIRRCQLRQVPSGLWPAMPCHAYIYRGQEYREPIILLPETLMGEMSRAAQDAYFAKKK